MNSVAGPTREIWQLGDLVVDVGRQSVRRGEQTLELPKLSFDLLLALARNAPSVMSNDALTAAVWPGLVVGPETVVQRVRLLRIALGDDAATPRYVAALRGRGYRLVVDAVRVDPLPNVPAATPEPTTPSASVATPQAPAPARHSAKRPRTPLLLAGGVIALLIAAVTWRQQHPRQPPADAAPSVADAMAHTVAVLPFRNLSADPDDAFIAQTLPEIVLDRLATVQGLTVIARESALRAGLPQQDLSVLRDQLRAGYLIDGSVQRNGEVLRVTARLVDSRTEAVLWSMRGDRRIAELFALQDEIATRVAATLETRIAGLQPAPGTAAPTANIEAYLAYLRGRAHVGRYSIVAAEAAAAEFERAVAQDPGFAAAHAALYDARMQAAAMQEQDAGEIRRRYRPILTRALELDPDSGAALVARAMWEEADNATREAWFREALRRDPGNTRGLVGFAEFLDVINGRAGAGRTRGSGIFQTPARPEAVPEAQRALRAREAAALLQRAMTIDPLSPAAQYRFILRTFKTIIDLEPQMQRLLSIDPEYFPALQRTAKYQWMMHDSPSQAIAIIEKAIAADPRNPWARQTALIYYLDIDDEAAAREVAEGAPASAVTAAPVLALFAGDTAGAARAARDEASMLFGFHESWGVAEALRDAALRSGDFAATERLLRERYRLPDEATNRIQIRTFRAAVKIAHLLLAQGRTEPGRRLLEDTIAWIDANEHIGKVYLRRTRAEALMLLGRKDEALRDLRTAFLVDRDHTEWWYTLSRNPVWREVHDEPAFQALVADAAAFVARERAAVEQLRQRGEIPRRGSSKPGRAPPA